LGLGPEIADEDYFVHAARHAPQHAFAAANGQVFSGEKSATFSSLMFGGLRVAVVVPAFNEELNVARTVRDIPAFVDHVLVVDDASHDRTFLEASRLRRRGLEVLQHPRNRGVGGAMATGCRRALALGVDASVVMAGGGP